MDCLPAQRSPGPFHYLINEQAKSLVALQELQNEVGALLEFRDLVIETFPHLRTKMAALASNTSSSGSPSTPSNIPIPLGSNLRREWEPGIKVRRKLQHGKDSDVSVPSLAAISRNRIKSHNQQPKSGECINSGSSTGSSAVQDSGFGTETSSSKEHHSTSTGGILSSPKILSSSSGVNAIPSSSCFCLQETEDELWNLLDVIHRKGTKLREEVESLHQKLQESERLENVIPHVCQRSLQDDILTDTNNIPNLSNNNNKHISSNEIQIQIPELFSKIDDRRYDSLEETELQNLRHERDILLDKVTEMEAETVTSRLKTSQLESQIGSLRVAKKDLEDQLKIAISQRNELNSRIQDLHLQFVANKNYSSVDASNSSLISLRDTMLIPLSKRTVSSNVSQNTSSSSQTFYNLRKDSGFIPVRTSMRNFSRETFPYVSAFHTPSVNHHSSLDSRTNDDVLQCEGASEGTTNLGALDGIISSPARVKRWMHGIAPDPNKIYAILQVLNPVELQRHLLTTSVEKESLKRQLKKSVTTQLHLSERLDKIKDENEDLRFQLEEKSIELEGTRARVRVLERLHQISGSAEDVSHGLILPNSATCNPVIPMLALPMPVDDNIHHSSSTESAHDHEHGYGKKTLVPPSSPRLRPSRIPLLGSKTHMYPKPPSGKMGVSVRKQKSSSFSVIGKTNKELWKNHSDSHLSVYEGKGQESSTCRSNRDSLCKKSRSDSLSKRSSGDSLSSGKIRDSSVSSSASFTNKHDGASGKSKDSSVRSPGTRKNFNRQMSTRYSSSANSSRGSLLDHGESISKVRPTKLSFWSNWLKILDSSQ